MFIRLYVHVYCTIHLLLLECSVHTCTCTCIFYSIINLLWVFISMAHVELLHVHHWTFNTNITVIGYFLNFLQELMDIEEEVEEERRQ